MQQQTADHALNDLMHGYVSIACDLGATTEDAEVAAEKLGTLIRAGFHCGPPGHWSKTPPSAPGWYWWRDDLHQARPVDVYMSDPSSKVTEHGLLVKTNGYSMLQPSQMGGEWLSERIVEPLS